METYDIIMLVVLAGATAFGAIKGLAWQVASLASIFVSYFAAVRFRGQVAGLLNVAPPWNTFLAMLIVYIACSLAIWMAFRFVSELINKVKLKQFDRQIGALFGLAKGVALCVVITLFSVTLLGEQLRGQIIRSRSGYYIAILLDKSHAVMPPEIHDVLEPYIHQLEDGLQPGERPPGLDSSSSGVAGQPAQEPLGDLRRLLPSAPGAAQAPYGTASGGSDPSAPYGTNPYGTNQYGSNPYASDNPYASGSSPSAGPGNPYGAAGPYGGAQSPQPAAPRLPAVPDVLDALQRVGEAAKRYNEARQPVR